MLWLGEDPLRNRTCVESEFNRSAIERVGHIYSIARWFHSWWKNRLNGWSDVDNGWNETVRWVAAGVFFKSGWQIILKTKTKFRFEGLALALNSSRDPDIAAMVVWFALYANQEIHVDVRRKPSDPILCAGRLFEAASFHTACPYSVSSRQPKRFQAKPNSKREKISPYTILGNL